MMKKRIEFRITSIFLILLITIQLSFVAQGQGYDYCAKFPSGKVANLGNVTELNNVSEFSIEMLVRFDDPIGWIGLFQNNTSTDDRVKVQIKPDEKIYFYLGKNGTKCTINTNAVMTPEEWMHIAIVYDNSLATADKIKIYVNGVSQAVTISGTIPSSTPSVTSDAILGQNNCGIQIDEFRVWKVALSQSDINNWKYKKVEKTHNQYKWNLKAYLNFDQQNGDGYLSSPYNGVMPVGTTYPIRINLREPAGVTGFFNTGDLASVSNVSDLDGVSKFTLEMKVKWDSIGAWTPIFSKVLDTNNRIVILNNQEKLYCRVANGGNSSVYSGNVLSKGDYIFISAVFDGSKGQADRLKLYINGSRVSTTASSTGLPATAPTLSGIDWTLGSGKFKGEVDEVRIWNTALPESSIYFNYASDLTSDHSEINNLVLYWNFDDKNTSQISAGLSTSYNGIINGVAYKDYITEVVGYVWNNTIDSVITSDHFNYLTQLNYFALIPDENGHLKHNANDSTKIANLKIKRGNRGTKICITIGGGSHYASQAIANIAGNATKRATLVQEAYDFVVKHGIDGVDLNWESGAGVPPLNQWTNFVNEYGAKFRPEGYRVTTAVGANTNSNWNAEQYMLNTVDNVDFFNVMGYWETASSRVNRFHNIGKKKKKMAIGTSFNTKVGGVPSGAGKPYYEIIEEFDPSINSDLASGYGYTGVVSQQERARYLRDLGTVGVMIWRIGLDIGLSEEKSLLKALGSEIPAPWDYTNKSAKISSFFTQKEKLDKTEISVFPNPVRDYLNLTNLDSKKKSLITLYNVDGIKIWAKQVYGVQNKKISMSDVNQGIYFLEIIGDKRECIKIIKQ